MPLSTRTVWCAKILYKLDSKGPSHGAAALSRWFALTYQTANNNIYSCHQDVWWKLPILRLLFECKYTATSIDYVNLELGMQNPPSNVHGEGPLRVELKLANGVCTEKGCTGISVSLSVFWHLLIISCNWPACPNVCFCSYSGLTLQFFLRRGGLSCQQNPKRAGVRASCTHEQEGSFGFPYSSSLLGNLTTQSAQYASVGHLDWWVTTFEIHDMHFFCLPATVKWLFYIWCFLFRIKHKIGFLNILTWLALHSGVQTCVIHTSPSCCPWTIA